MAWRWTAKRLAISGFLIFHLTSVVVWILPGSPLKQAMQPVFQSYMLPLGLWQSWWMFAPDPMRATVALESEVIDAQGMRHLYAFPTVEHLPLARKLPRFRHAKFACNLLGDEFESHREFASRHAVRQLGLRPDAFPVHVSLYCQIKELPPPGQCYSDPLAAKRIHPLGTYDFASIDEVHP